MPVSAYTAKIMRRTASCQVSDCTATLDKAFYKRYKVCPGHASEAKVVLNGAPMRFCKGHGRFEPLDRFDGDRKGCREMLEGVNRRRKRKKQVEEGGTTTEEEEGGSSAGASDDDDAGGGARKSQRRRWRSRRAASPSESDTLPSTASKESMQTMAGPGGLALPAALLAGGAGALDGVGRTQMQSLSVEDIISLQNDPLLPTFSGAATADLAEILITFPVPPLPHQVINFRSNPQQHQNYRHHSLLTGPELLAVTSALPTVSGPMSAPLPGPALEMLAQLHTVHHVNTNSANQSAAPR